MNPASAGVQLIWNACPEAERMNVWQSRHGKLEGVLSRHSQRPRRGPGDWCRGEDLNLHGVTPTGT